MDAKLNHTLRSVMTVIVAGTLIIVLFHSPAQSTGLYVLAGIYMLSLLLRDYVAQIRLGGSGGALYLCLQLALAIALTVKSESFIAQINILMLVGEFAFFQARGLSLAFTTASYVGCVLSMWIASQFPTFDQLFYLLPRVIEYYAIFGVSLLAKIAFQQKAQLALDNERLRVASIELERKAKLQERTRISREIHDSVGHTLTSALTGLQTASHAIEKRRYDLARDMIDRTQDYIRSGLDDVRSSVHLLRENMLGPHFVPELMKLLEQTEKQTGVAIACAMDELWPELPPKVELAIYRALQEGLSNGIRHGGSTAFQVALKRKGRRLVCTLADNGRAPEELVHGFGLNAMKERVEDAGGTLHVGKNEAGGVTLKLDIPLPDEP